MEKVSDWEAKRVKLVTSIYALQGIGFLVFLFYILARARTSHEYTPGGWAVAASEFWISLLLFASVLFLAAAFGIYKGESWARHLTFLLSSLSLLFWGFMTEEQAVDGLQYILSQPWLLVTCLALTGINLAGIYFLKINKTIKMVLLGIWILLLRLLSP